LPPANPPEAPPEQPPHLADERVPQPKDEPRPIMDMHGKTVLITGANSGVGFAAAQNLAAAGARIVMVCRDQDRGEDARAQIAEVATGPAPELLLADLSSQGQIRRLAKTVREGHDRVDVLLNNAGSVFNKGAMTVDGIESTFATNHLAPFLLTNLLLGQVRTAPAGRVVTVASEIYSRKLDFENLQGERSYNFFKAYQQSKLCNVLFAYELARRLEGTTVTSNVVSPGPSKTGFGANMTGPALTFTRVMKATPRFGSPEKGARTLVYAAADPSLEGVTGKFFYKSRELETRPVTHDSGIAARLWRVCAELSGLAPDHQGAEMVGEPGGHHA
jgi:NAD(P)-dependent dehydrogenase (short-subunit alcohol dehydrogenase family)